MTIPKHTQHLKPFTFTVTVMMRDDLEYNDNRITANDIIGILEMPQLVNVASVIEVAPSATLIPPLV